METLLKYEGEKFLQNMRQAFVYEVKWSYREKSCHLNLFNDFEVLLYEIDYWTLSSTNYNISISDIAKGLKIGKVTKIN